MENWIHNPTEYHCSKDVETYGPDLLPRKGVTLCIGASNTGKSTWLLSMLNWWDASDGGEYKEDITAYEGCPPSFWYFAFEDADNMRNACDGILASHTEQLSLTDPDKGYRRLQGRAYAYQCWKTQTLWTPPPGSLDLTDMESVEGFCVIAHHTANKMKVDTPNIIVLDNLSLCIGDADENESLTARKIIRGCQRILDYFEGTDQIILVHHTARDTDRPRGSDTLFNLSQGVVVLKGTGDTVTATCTKMKGGKRNAQRKYKRKIMQGPRTTYVDFEDITDVTTKPVKAAPASQANPAPVTAPTTLPDAPQAAPVPQAPPHPADALRGRPLEAWRVLGLAAGGALPLADAEKLVTSHTCFEGTEPRRRAARFRQLVQAWTAKGLVDRAQGLVVNPA